MPKHTIENAILKGTGELGGENYETATYEGYGPGGVAVLIDALTNNRARTAPEMRLIFEKGGGNFGASGSVAFQFTKRGVITIKTAGVDEDQLIELALESGADDVNNAGEVFEVLTNPTLFMKVRDALIDAKIPIEASEITNMPNNTVAVEGETAHRLLKLVDALEDNDDVQSVSHNAEIPESVTA